MKNTFFKLPTLFILSAVLFISCSKKEDFTQEETTTANFENGLTFRKASLKNQEIIFSLFDDDGNEITENVTYYVDGAPLAGNSFSSDVDAEFEVYAEFIIDGAEFVTETDMLKVITPKKKPVVEDYTGTWCGNCPAVNAAIEEIIAQGSDITVVAIHNGDEFTLPFEQALRDALEVFPGSPRGRIDRTISWGSGTNFPAEDVLGLVGNTVNSAISIKSTVSNNTIFAEVAVASEDELSGRKLVVYLVEDGLVAPQTNYFDEVEDSPYFGLGDPIENFVHDHTLRHSFTNIIGDEIPSTSALVDYVTNYSFDIPADFNVENLHIVAILTDMDNNAINSQHALVNEAKSYE